MQLFIAFVSSFCVDLVFRYSFAPLAQAVPRKFSAVHLRMPKTVIVLRNMTGDCWNVTSACYGLQTKFCKGWPLFVHHNGLKVGDICIFELVDDRVFQVHIFEASHTMSQCLLSNDALDDDSATPLETLECIHLP